MNNLEQGFVLVFLGTIAVSSFWTMLNANASQRHLFNLVLKADTIAATAIRAANYLERIAESLETPPVEITASVADPQSFAQANVTSSDLDASARNRQTMATNIPELSRGAPRRRGDN